VTPRKRLGPRAEKRSSDSNARACEGGGNGKRSCSSDVGRGRRSKGAAGGTSPFHKKEFPGSRRRERTLKVEMEHRGAGFREGSLFPRRGDNIKHPGVGGKRGLWNPSRHELFYRKENWYKGESSLPEEDLLKKKNYTQKEKAGARL